MEPDNKKLIEDLHKAYFRLMEMADSMSYVTGADKVLINEGVISLMHAMANFEQAIPETKKWETRENVVKLARPYFGPNPASR